MSSDTKAFIGVVIFVVVLVGGIIFLNNRSSNNSTSSSDSSNQTTSVNQTDNLNPDNWSADKIDRLAKYMTAQGMAMYGASWCPHCQAQKRAFGDAEKDIKYVECSTSTKESGSSQTAECANVAYKDTETGNTYTGIQGYPTWVYNGRGYSGEMTMAKLAQIVGFTDTNTSTAQ